jgi:hypothetical protein
VPGKLSAEKQEEFKLKYALLKGNLKKSEVIYISWIASILSIKQEPHVAGILCTFEELVFAFLVCSATSCVY